MSETSNHSKTIPFPVKAGDRPSPQVPGDSEAENQYPALRLLTLPAGEMVEFRRPEAVIGRHHKTDFQVLEPDVSRRHCRLFNEDGQWYAEDLESLNGTLVNGERIGKVVLHSNDVIRIGGKLFQVEVERSVQPLAIRCPEDDERGRNVLQSIATMLMDEEVDPSERRRRKSA